MFARREVMVEDALRLDREMQKGERTVMDKLHNYGLHVTSRYLIHRRMSGLPIRNS
jgi:hypothetical protein